MGIDLPTSWSGRRHLLLRIVGALGLCRVVIPTHDRTMPTVVACLGQILTSGTVYGTVHRTVKSIGVTELRQRTAEILEGLRDAEEPVAILQRSQTTAYLVDARRYEAEREELRTARRALFLREVREAEAEYTTSGATTYADMDALLDDLRG